MNLTLKAYIDWVQSGKYKVQSVLDHYLKKAKKLNKKYNAFTRFHENYVEKNLTKFKDLPLHGAPIGIKDIMLTKWYISSCGSKMLEDYVSPYSATCFEKLEKNWWLMIGKTNMDEFAMGSSTETSYFGITKNTYGTDRVPGGSSWWSAVAVASDVCLGALWTDTWGSIRQPAALCGIVGMKPTYWMVSRYGVQSMASSFDQVWVLTKTVDDAEILLNAIRGFDERDLQSDLRSDKWRVTSDVNVKKFKIAIPKEAMSEGLDEKVKARFLETVEKLRATGVQVDDISLPLLSYGLSIYYTLMPAEVSTNLARFDGVKFGLQGDTMLWNTIAEYYEKIRSEGFGDEVKRRILLGTFVLSSANYEWYYLRAQKTREQLTADMDKVFSNYDIILTPTSPEVARKLWAKSGDPLKMYLADMYTIPANIAWLPAMSVPMGTIEDDGEEMPVWIQLMANRWNEGKIFALGKVIESLGL